MRIRDRLTYANVMATIAVFGVLAGAGAYAGSRIGTNDIARHAVSHPKLDRAAVSTANVRNHSLRAKDLAAGASGNIVARARGDSHVSPSHHNPQPYPVEGGTWTQAPDGLNLIYGRFNFEIPAGCDRSIGTSDAVGISVYVDGSSVGGVDDQAPGRAFGPFLLWEPGQATERKLTFVAGSGCGPNTTQNPTVTSVQADVVEFR